MNKKRVTNKTSRNDRRKIFMLDELKDLLSQLDSKSLDAVLIRARRLVVRQELKKQKAGKQ